MADEPTSPNAAFAGLPFQAALAAAAAGAVQFDATGLFGRGEAARCAEAPASPLARLSQLPPAPPDPATSTTAHSNRMEASASAFSPPIRRVAPNVSAPRKIVEQSRSPAPEAPPAPAERPAAMRRPPSNASSSEVRPRSAARTEFLRQNQQASAVFVAVAAAETGLRVSVRAPALDALERARLRSAVSALISSHGRSGELSLNGEILDATGAQRHG
ncbi:MAG TPA: hypothetical protein VEA80_00815 [Vitreimonas sp.]|uniref:hypothetical protein n=1 Tax=Vitreimonas sp. TaxID=3069702 RepID=UPI002D50CB6E|nr:hypothetical protein [Vitreimonas sp.]HYD85992.1 hypothetical protein [Vitreimonas sp.]